MPTYDYECSSCGHKFELFQSMSAKPQKSCPNCGKRTAQRLIGAGGGLIFKGSGFYITDYRSSDYKSKASSDAPAKPAADKTCSGGKAKSDCACAKSAPATPKPVPSKPKAAAK
jgi:putative FmdB family regulatory protein